MTKQIRFQLSEKQEKIQKLDEECESYQCHLKLTIAKLARALPKQAREQYYDQNHRLDIQRIIERANLGRTLLPWDMKSSQGWCHSRETYPRLHQAIERYNVIETLRAPLADAHKCVDEKLAGFKTTFHQADVQQLLTSQRDPAGIRFLKAVGHILTLGLVSKAQKGTFAFWKSYGEVVSQKLKAEIGQQPTSKMTLKLN